MASCSRATAGWCIVFGIVSTAPLGAQRMLVADGKTAAYALIEQVLGTAPETPDCGHADFGPHITQRVDPDLKKPVFIFNLHVAPDNDRCTGFDRQRLEIKTDGHSPPYMKGLLGDRMTFRWLFELPAGFQPSTNFTHIHQIKAFDGDASLPIITLTLRKGDPNRLELILVDSHGVPTKLTTATLEPFIGQWVEAYETITYGHHGKYSIVLRALRDRATLLEYASDNLDLWRTDTTMVRPKWGIYRSLKAPADLRDESVSFDRFCLAKGSDDCAPTPGASPPPRLPRP